MKLNFLKAGARILLVVFFFSLLIISCEKDDQFVQPDAKTQNHEFFKHQKTGGDEFKTYILDCLAQADDSLSFTGDFVKTYGFPQWDCGMSFNVEDRNSLIIPILDKTNKSISALYYLKYSGNDIETYLFMNDHDDAAYSYLSRMIQYFEKIMDLKISNDDIIVTIEGSDGIKKTKARSEIMETCYSWEQVWIDSNGKSHYDPYKECFIHIEVRSDFHTSRGDWNLNSSGNYKPNDSYNGGSGNGNGEPEPIDPVEITKKQIQKDLCNTFNGIVNISSIKENIDELSLPQEQFIIGLANIAAMSELGLPFTSLKNDLGNYPNDSNLYSKLNKLNNHEKYTANWERTGNSSANCDYALISPEINSSGFQLKFYPEKNGEYNALGLVKDGLADHTIEGALEYIEGWLRDNQDFEDDFLYDMHLYNALNFMEDYCND